MISHKKIKEMLNNWNISNPTITDMYYEGSGIKSENTWYVNDDHVLKVGTNFKRLENHIAVSKALFDSGLDSAVPVKTESGTEYVMNGDLYFYLTKKLPGNSIKSGQCYEGDYITKARYLGEIIGQLHKTLVKFDNTIICDEPDMYDTIKNWAIPNVKKAMNLPENFYNDYLKTFGSLFPTLPKHVIHRDPNPSNIIMKNDKVTGFVDFDLTEKNVRLFDPCYASTAILSESFAENNEEKRQKWLHIFQNIINGYDSICRLSDEEKQSIPYIVYSIQLICVAYFSSLDKFKTLADTNKAMLAWLIEQKDNLIII